MHVIAWIREGWIGFLTVHQFRVLTVLLFSELTFNFSVHSQEVFASVFFAPESDDNIGQHGNKQVSVLRQLTPCRNWNKHKIQTVQSEKKHSVLLCCLSQLPFRRRSIVNVSRLMRSAALKQCWISSPWEGGTGRGNDTLIMYSLQETWDTAWDTLSQQPHHFLVSKSQLELLERPRLSIRQTPARTKQTELSWNLITMTVSQNVTTGPLLFWGSAWHCVTTTCDEARCPGTGQTMSHWWYQVLMSSSEQPTPGS